MSVPRDFGWRDRAIGLAAVGAAALARSAFAPAHSADPQPLEMQVLVSLALQDSYFADAPPRTGTHWLSRVLRSDPEVIEAAVGILVQGNLVTRRSDAADAIRYELSGEDDEHLIAGELPVALTNLGLATVDQWLIRVRSQFQGWPADRPGVDDVVD